MNRYWKHFFKRGLIEPEDDIRDSNPADQSRVTGGAGAALRRKRFRPQNAGADHRPLQGVSVDALPNELNQADAQNYSHFYLKRLQAEVLLDALDQVTGATTTFANLPPGTRAIALPDNSYNRASPLLSVFGRPENTSVCECERVQSSSLAQSLHMLNSSAVKAKLSVAGGRIDRLVKQAIEDSGRVRELYLAAYSREPTSEELQAVIEYLAEPVLDEAGNPIAVEAARRRNFEDLLWAILNTKEFLFNH